MSTTTLTPVDLLQNLRSRGWSDIAIGQALRVDRASVWRWRTGKTQPSPTSVTCLVNLQTLNQFAQHLDALEGRLDDSKGPDSADGSLPAADDAWFREFFGAPVQ